MHAKTNPLTIFDRTCSEALPGFLMEQIAHLCVGVHLCERYRCFQSIGEGFHDWFGAVVESSRTDRKSRVRIPPAGVVRGLLMILSVDVHKLSQHGKRVAVTTRVFSLLPLWRKIF